MVQRRRHGGWYNEPRRHALAARGIKTHRKGTRCLVKYDRGKCLVRSPFKSVAKSYRPTESEVMKRVASMGAPTDKLPKNPAEYYREKYPDAWWPEDLDWDYLEKELEMAEPEKDFFGEERREIVIGNIQSATPSGKYYTPWASSNVSETEALADAWAWAELELAAQKRGLYIGSSEYDPLDITLGKVSG
jgi:hypothetical protein